MKTYKWNTKNLLCDDKLNKNEENMEIFFPVTMPFHIDGEGGGDDDDGEKAPNAENVKSIYYDKSIYELADTHTSEWKKERIRELCSFFEITFPA